MTGLKSSSIVCFHKLMGCKNNESLVFIIFLTAMRVPISLFWLHKLGQIAYFPLVSSSLWILDMKIFEWTNLIFGFGEGDLIHFIATGSWSHWFCDNCVVTATCKQYDTFVAELWQYWHKWIKYWILSLVVNQCQKLNIFGKYEILFTLILTDMSVEIYFQPSVFSWKYKRLFT